jgi:multiple sugar transport system permease protein
MSQATSTTPVTPRITSGAVSRTLYREWDRDRVETVVFRVLRWVFIAIFLAVTLFPFYYMVLLSVRPIESLLLEPARVWPTVHDLTVSTYKNVLTPVSNGGQGFLTFLGNSGLIALATVAITLAVAIPGSYAVSRLRFMGRRKVSFLFLAVYLFPSIVLAIPLFVFFTRIGLRGSLIGLIFVYISQTAPVAIYMLRNYFETVPYSLEEAASVDGASRLRIIWSISLPLARPAVVATALYVFMIAWNEYLFALLFLIEDRSRWTVSLGLAQLAGSIDIPTTTLMAGSVILTVPVVILFLISERMLVEGLTAGADKG